MTTPTDLLTAEELSILSLITDAANRFAALPEHHPEDVREWCSTVHILQRQIMARAARRAYPAIFRSMDINSCARKLGDAHAEIERLNLRAWRPPD